MKNVDIMLDNLCKSKFRSSFHLNNKMKNYVKEKGFDTIRKHAYEIISNRLKPEYISNDGKQTPMRQVHPVYIAQHACACCCRVCLQKWHKISRGRELSDDEINYVVDILITWIKRECNYRDGD